MAPEAQARSSHGAGFLEPPPSAGMGGSSFPWIMVASVHLPSLL